MTEREFDKFFKDRIGDEEQSFDFRTDDWLAAAHDLDKVLPVAAPVVVPPTRLLTWHKWSAAAAVVFLASQVWLIAKIMDLKHEVSSLKQENVALAQPEHSIAPEKRLETVVQYDTVFKSVVIEKPIYKTPLLNDNTTPSQLTDNNKTSKNNGLQPAQLNSKELSITDYLKNKTQNDKNSTPIIITNQIQKENNLITDKTTEEAKANNRAIVDNNSTIIEKNDLKTVEKSNNIDKTDTNNSLDNNAINALRGKDALAALPNVGLQTVKSNSRESAILNMNEWLMLQKRSIIQPAPLMTNGWTLGANSLFLLNEVGRNKSILNHGANIRLAYDLRSNWRLTADANFYGESHPHPDSLNSHNPPISPPSIDYNLSKVNQKSKNIAIRIGADYEWMNKSAVTPFIGFGLAYQLKTLDETEYEFKSPRNPTIPFSVRNNERKDDKPLSLSLRVGAMGKIYRRLGWSVNIGKDLPFSSRTNQLLNGQIGFSYTL